MKVSIHRSNRSIEICNVNRAKDRPGASDDNDDDNDDDEGLYLVMEKH